MTRSCPGGRERAAKLRLRHLTCSGTG